MIKTTTNATIIYYFILADSQEKPHFSKHSAFKQNVIFAKSLVTEALNTPYALHSEPIFECNFSQQSQIETILLDLHHFTVQTFSYHCTHLKERLWRYKKNRRYKNITRLITNWANRPLYNYYLLATSEVTQATVS